MDMRPKLVVVANYGSTENRPPDVSDGRDEGKRSSGPGASKPSEEMLRSILIADRSQSSAGAALQIHQHRGDLHEDFRHEVGEKCRTITGHGSRFSETLPVLQNENTI